MNRAEKGAFMELINRVEDHNKKIAFMGSRINELMDKVDELEKKVKDLEQELDTGTHEDGLGWNANGEFCGECSAKTCRGCANEYTIDF